MAVVVQPIDASAGAPAYTAQQSRQAFSAHLGGARSGRPLGAYSGVRPGTPSTTVVLSGAGSTTWTVGAHAGVLDTQSAAAAGPYEYATDGTDTGTITADGSNPRIDVIWVTVNDTVQDGSGLRNGTIGYSVGTASGTPSAPGVGQGTPAVPARAMILAQTNVPKAGTGNPTVTWVAPYCVAAGGSRPWPTAASLLASTGGYDGELAWAQDTDLQYAWVNGAWGVLADPVRFTAWTAYTPTWTGATSGTGVLGTGGSLAGWHKKVGFLCDWKVVMVTGSDAVGPTGSYQISLPFQAQMRGSITIVGSSLFVGGTNVHGDCIADAGASGNKFQIGYHGSAGNAGSGNPASWAGRTVTFWGRYETAV